MPGHGGELHPPDGVVVVERPGWFSHPQLRVVLKRSDPASIVTAQGEYSLRAGSPRLGFTFDVAARTWRPHVFVEDDRTPGIAIEQSSGETPTMRVVPSGFSSSDNFPARTFGRTANPTAPADYDQYDYANYVDPRFFFSDRGEVLATKTCFGFMLNGLYGKADLRVSERQGDEMHVTLRVAIQTDGSRNLKTAP